MHYGASKQSSVGNDQRTKVRHYRMHVAEGIVGEGIEDFMCRTQHACCIKALTCRDAVDTQDAMLPRQPRRMLKPPEAQLEVCKPVHGNPSHMVNASYHAHRAEREGRQGGAQESKGKPASDRHYALPRTYESTRSRGSPSVSTCKYQQYYADHLPAPNALTSCCTVCRPD
eukprot:1158022-Pelagomonas_calceolata.AAC.7